MPTSGETAWTRTAGDVVKSAMVELGVINMADEPENAEYDEAIVRLNGYLQELDVEGLMFREATGTLLVGAGTGGATLPDEIRDVSAARIVTANASRPLLEWNRSEYYAIPNRSQTGQNPLAYYIKKTPAGRELVLWPVNSGAVTLHIDYQRPVEVITTPDDELDFPAQWINCITMNLASRIASMFGSDRINPATVARVDGRAAQLQQRLLDDDRPDSYVFESYARA